MEEAVSIGWQILDALAAAHDAGVIHRDIKPGNIFLCRTDGIGVLDCRPKLVDFGVAANTDAHIARTGDIIGTPAYMAPEQALGYELDGRADLYALGCIGFFLLSGRLLFERNGSLPMMMAHITDAPPELKSHVPNYLPAELSAVLLRCLAKKPNGRPSNARALAAALKAIHIPPDQAWSEAQAQAWWAARKPKAEPVAHDDRIAATQLAQRGVA